MPNYTVTDPGSGKTVTLTGDSPPSESELTQVFSQIGGPQAQPQGQSKVQPQEQSGLRDAVASPFEVANQSTTAQGFNPNPEPGPMNPYVAGLLTNQPVEGFGPNLMRAVPATIGGGIAGPAGAAAGEAIRQAIANTNAVAANQEPATPGQVVTNVLKAGAAQKAAQVASPLVGKFLIGGQLGFKAPTGLYNAAFEGGAEPTLTAIPGETGGILGLAGKAASGIRNYLQTNLGGVSQSTGELINQDANAVAARLGVTKPEIGALADNLRAALSEAADNASKQYGQVAKAITKGPQPPVIDLNGTIGEAVNEIKSTYGYASPGTPGSIGANRIVSPDEVAKFNAFSDLIQQSKNATPEQVYYLQRDINAAIRNNRGTTLASALGQVKGLINQALPQMAETSGSAELAQLAKANSGYAAAQELQESAHGLSNANDAIQYIKNAYSPNKYSSQAKDALESVGQQIPAVGALIREARLSMAAEEAGHLFRSLPQTGMGAGIAGAAGAGAHALMGAGIAGQAAGAAAGAAVFPLFSPRAYLAAAQIGQTFGRPAAQVTAGAAQASAPLAAHALSRMSPESIAAFYRSPGDR